MDIYRFSLSIEDEITAESQEEAWKIAKDRVVGGFYGPTQANIEFLEEVPGPAQESAAES